MNFTCNECNDTGSRDKSGDYLDCGYCDTASERATLNKFAKELDRIHPEDLHWAIHQRALAMAPKQEALAVQGPYAWVNAGTERQQTEYATLSVGPENPWMDSANAFPVYAAPAAANGAPELPRAGFRTDMHIDGKGQAAYSADQMRAYGQACAAAGPDAALTDDQVHQGVMALLGCTSSEVEYYSAKLYEGYANDVQRVHAPLSGAKGN